MGTNDTSLCFFIAKLSLRLIQSSHPLSTVLCNLQINWFRIYYSLTWVWYKGCCYWHHLLVILVAIETLLLHRIQFQIKVDSLLIWLKLIQVLTQDLLQLFILLSTFRDSYILTVHFLWWMNDMYLHMLRRCHDLWSISLVHVLRLRG